MKITHFRSIIAASCLTLFAPSLLAEIHTFTNTKGKTIQAEITAVSSRKVSIKTAKGKKFSLPISKLSDKDQTYVKDWHEKNKYNVKASNLRLDITKKNRPCPPAQESTLNDRHANTVNIIKKRYHLPLQARLQQINTD